MELPKDMFSKEMFDICVDTILLSILAISVISSDEFGIIEHIVELNFSYLESIHGCHVFTKEVYHEMI
ncbi:8547_t:CDS:2 [Funneliformis mosseae]|uniref:8547_t:CDS:1 n=1 Tax=Funneliformis mosseae TaxID=27381 RepID=A0A9N9GS52_FUNMO|nr:8547_t:CDS:2 [Funneliformis mosseae]